MRSLQIAHIISVLLNPLVVLIPVPYVLVFTTSGDFVYAFHWAVFSWVFLLALVAFVLLGIERGVFSNIDVSIKEQRPTLYVFCTFVAVLYITTLHFLHGPNILLITTLGILVGILVMSVVNQFVKASVHMATIASLLFALMILYHQMIVISLVVMPLLAWARIKTGRHSATEVLTGGILGSLLTLGIYLAYRLFF